MKAEAAVAVIHVRRPRPAVLLVRRAEVAGDPWAGHWAFPGGRHEARDPDLLATCRRETREECGFELRRADLAGELPLARAGNHVGSPVMVAPFLWHLVERPALAPDPREVAAVRWLPLVEFERDHDHRRGPVNPRDRSRTHPHLMLDGTPLWGFTYEVLRRTFGGSP